MERGIRLFKVAKYHARLASDPVIADTQSYRDNDQLGKQNDPSSSSANYNDLITNQTSSVSEGSAKVDVVKVSEAISTNVALDNEAVQKEQYIPMGVFEECQSGQWLSRLSTNGILNLTDTILSMHPSTENEMIDSKEQSILSGVDLSRITPKYFLQREGARAAVVKELL